MELAPSWWKGKARTLQCFTVGKKVALVVYLFLSIACVGGALVTDPLEGAILEKIHKEWLQHNASLWDAADPCASPPFASILSCTSQGRVRLLDLRGQEITGSLLPEIGNLTSLEILYLSRNKFTGSIPFSYQQLVKLQQLELFQTQISGSIPEWLGAMPALAYLDLSSNQLWGTIPVTFQDSALSAWNFSNNYLRGPIPDNLRVRTKPQIFVKLLENNCFSIADIDTTAAASSLALQRSTFDCASFYNNSVPSQPSTSAAAKSPQVTDLNAVVAQAPSLLQTPNVPASQAGAAPRTRGVGPAEAPNPGSSATIPPPTRQGSAGTGGKGQKPSPNMLPAIAGGASAVLLLVAVAIFAFVWLRCRKRKASRPPPAPVSMRSFRSEKDLKKKPQLTAHALEAQFISLEGLPNAPILFSFEEIRKATENFAAERKLGDNGFGSMYRGVLPSDGREVAIKVLPDSIQQVSHEFLMEVSLTCQLRHPHLVRLRGWCAGKAKPPILVYKYYHGGSLDKRLFPKEGAPIMPWNERFRVLKGVSLALNYMHEERKEPAVHRDVKCSNIVLDLDGNGYLGNYGLAALAGDQDLPAAGRHAKTYAHLPPEAYILPTVESNRPTVNWDTFSFGVVCLEIASGQRAYDRDRSAEEDGNEKFLWWHALKLFKAGKLRSLADPNLKDTEHSEDEVFRVLSVGICCVTRRPEFRPRMSQVLQMLQAPADAPVPAPPAGAEDGALQPVFSQKRRPMNRVSNRGQQSPKRPSAGPTLSTIKESGM